MHYTDMDKNSSRIYLRQNKKKNKKSGKKKLYETDGNYFSENV